jgi:drug/metabolite transporter (DMT)-like permease
MESDQLGVLMCIIVPIAAFAMTFGIVYLNRRERMAMIERGMDPRTYKPRAAPYQNLKWGMLFIGAGIGLFIAYILSNTLFAKDDSGNPAIYISLVTLFGGLGLFVSFLIERKALLDDK